VHVAVIRINSIFIFLHVSVNPLNFEFEGMGIEFIRISTWQGLISVDHKLNVEIFSRKTRSLG
jgi:hypothetical protein